MINEKNKLQVNMILNAIKGVMSVLFPLITFPYISRVLGVDNIGKYNFSYSIICYFILIADLGIQTYAIREGARFRNKKCEIDKFASQIFSINIISMLISYLLFFICLILFENLSNYKILLLILSLQIIFKTITVDWLYNIFEDYTFITIRSIIFQIIAMILMFAFVKDENDVEIYAFTTVVASAGAGILNLLFSKKHCHLGLTLSLDLKKHFKPIIILFALTLTVTIYVSSDVTILGIVCGDTTVGIYSVSVKIYTVAKTLLTSILLVSVPHLAAALGENNNNKFNSTAKKIHSTLISLTFPMMTGICLLHDEIIEVVAGKEYIAASSSLILLSIAIIFGMLSYFWSQCILINFKKDFLVFRITLLSAIINILLNIILIPAWKENAAAITTIISEGVSFSLCYFYGEKYVNMNEKYSILLKTIVGCLLMAILTYFLKSILVQSIVSTMIIILIDIFTYCVTQIVLKNEAILDFIIPLMSRLKGRHDNNKKNNK